MHTLRLCFCEKMSTFCEGKKTVIFELFQNGLAANDGHPNSPSHPHECAMMLARKKLERPFPLPDRSPQNKALPHAQKRLRSSLSWNFCPLHFMTHFRGSNFGHSK